MLNGMLHSMLHIISGHNYYFGGHIVDIPNTNNMNQQSTFNT